MCSLFEKRLQDSFELGPPETFLTQNQNSGIGLRLQVCLNDAPLDLPCHRVHPRHLLCCRSSQCRFARRLLSHHISHLIAKYERHVVILVLDIRSRNVRSLPLTPRMFLVSISGLETFVTRDRGCYLVQVAVWANPHPAFS